ncbi:MAG: alpha/beta hydrolase [Phycisphaerae bacterium]|nr:alpha/beta hydrolase [Phycisphaerae bacterium]
MREGILARAGRRDSRTSGPGSIDPPPNGKPAGQPRGMASHVAQWVMLFLRDALDSQANEISMSSGHAARHTEDGLPSLARRPLRRRLWFRAVTFVAILYAAWCTALYLCQDKLLFARDLAPDPSPLPYDAVTEELRRSIEDGAEAVAWFIPARNQPSGKPAPLVIFFHGNAEIIDYQSTVVEGYRRLGCSVLLPEYRGYGRCGGKPSEQGIVSDAVYFYDQVIQRCDVDASHIVFHGRSLGGGPAAALAARRRPNVLILESTFASVTAMARAYLVPSFLVKAPFRTDRVLESLDVPVLIFHGTQDDIIPVSHGRRLRDAARHGTYVEYGCRHNDFPGRGNEDAYWQEIRAFLKRNGIDAGV